MTTTSERARARFLLEMTLDQERLKARIAKRLRAHRISLRPPDGIPQLDYRDRFVLEGETISYRQYQRWEAGDSMPEWKWMVVIADVLGVTQQELLAEDDEDAIPAEAASGEEAEAADEVAAWARVERRLRRIEEALGIAQDDSGVPPSGEAANGG